MTVDDATHNTSTVSKQTSKNTPPPYFLSRFVVELLQCSSSSVLFDSVVKTIAILDVQHRQGKGSTSYDYKAKFLLSCWFSSLTANSGNVNLS